MKNHTFKEVSEFDNDLHHLALYEVTEGKLIIPKSINHMVDIQIKIVNKFNYYKKLIHDGECTYEFIKWDVLGRFGPFPREKVNKGDIYDYSKMTEYLREKESMDAKAAEKAERISDTLDAFFDVISSGPGKGFGESLFDGLKNLPSLEPLSDDELPPPFFKDDIDEDEDEDEKYYDEDEDLPF